MPFMPVLDVAIGLCFLYLLLALLCTTLNETIAGMLQTRGKMMFKGIERLLGDPELAKKVYNHPLIRKLSLNEKDPLPSYIPSDKFALVLMDIVTGKKATDNPEALREPLKDGTPAANPTSQESTPTFNADFRQALGAVLQSTSPTLITDQQKIEAWFNDQMDRVSGWYKKHTQLRIYALAVVITLALNADTSKIAKTLWTQPALTAAVVEAAQNRVAKGRPDDETQPMVEYENPNDPTKSKAIHVPPGNTLDEKDREILGALTGWKGDWVTDWKKVKDAQQAEIDGGKQSTANAGNNEKQRATNGDWIVFLLLTKLPGWVVTILAVSLGAPFWFDMLNRFMNIRNAGRAPDEPRDKSTPQPATAGAK